MALGNWLLTPLPERPKIYIYLVGETSEEGERADMDNEIHDMVVSKMLYARFDQRVRKLLAGGYVPRSLHDVVGLATRPVSRATIRALVDAYPRPAHDDRRGQSKWQTAFSNARCWTMSDISLLMLDSLAATRGIGADVRSLAPMLTTVEVHETFAKAENTNRMWKVLAVVPPPVSSTAAVPDKTRPPARGPHKMAGAHLLVDRVARMLIVPVSPLLSSG